MPHPLITPSDLLPLSDFELALLDAALRRTLEHDPALTDRDRETLMYGRYSIGFEVLRRAHVRRTMLSS